MSKKEVILLPLILLALFFLAGCTSSQEPEILVLTPEEEKLSQEFEKCEALLSPEIIANCKENVLDIYGILIEERNECNFLPDPTKVTKCVALFYQKTAIELDNRNFCNFINTDNDQLPNSKEITKIKRDCFSANTLLSEVKNSLKEIKQQPSENFFEWLNIFPIYYSEVNEVYLSKIKIALNDDDEESCLEITDDPTEINVIWDCQNMFIKQEAFLEKDYEICATFKSNIKLYEECTAPIIAYVSIAEENNYCLNSLTTPRLQKQCEKDYENYK